MPGQSRYRVGWSLECVAIHTFLDNLRGAPVLRSTVVLHIRAVGTAVRMVRYRAQLLLKEHADRLVITSPATFVTRRYKVTVAYGHRLRQVRWTLPLASLGY